MRAFLGLFLIGLLVCTCKNTETKKVILIDKDSLNREELKSTVINDSMETKWITDDCKHFWTPSRNQLDIADSLTVKAIKMNYKKYYKHLKPDSFKDFYKQYVCYIDSKGDSIIYLNAICYIGNDIVFDKNNKATQTRFDWQNHLFIVDDGGDCFWSIYINFSKRISFRFSVNGVA